MYITELAEKLIFTAIFKVPLKEIYIFIYYYLLFISSKFIKIFLVSRQLLAASFAYPVAILKFSLKFGRQVVYT